MTAASITDEDGRVLQWGICEDPSHLLLRVTDGDAVAEVCVDRDGWPWLAAGMSITEPLVTESDSSLLSGTHEAVFSRDRAYRYLLTRLWDSEPPMTWIMLNPSTANAFADDPTIRRCVKFARREGCGGIAVVNLFALRSTDPCVLRHHADPIGPRNDRFIAEQAVEGPVVVAWGAHAFALERGREVGRRLLAAGLSPLCLGVTKDGHPKHPLARGKERVPDDAPLARWEPAS